MPRLAFKKIYAKTNLKKSMEKQIFAKIYRLKSVHLSLINQRHFTLSY